MTLRGKEPNGRYLLSKTCPTGEHVGSVEVYIAGGEMTMEYPIVYACGCTWDQVASKYRDNLERYGRL